MADLTTGDVQRAVQDGTRDIMNHIQRVEQQVQQLGNVQRALSQIDGMQQHIAQVARQMQSVSAQIDQLVSRTVSSSNADQRVAMIHQDIADMKVRFNSIEKFAHEISNYFEQQDRDRQNTQ